MATAARRVDEFTITTALGDLRFIDREDATVAQRREIRQKLHQSLDSIPDTPLCKPEEEGIEIAKAYVRFRRELRDGTMTKRDVYDLIQPELKAARDREMCLGDFKDHNFVITRPGNATPLAMFTLYFIKDAGVNRSGVQGIECSVIPGLPNPGSRNWFLAFADILRWFLFNTFKVNGVAWRVLKFNMPPADLGPEWNWQDTQRMVNRLRNNGVVVILHPNTPEQDRYNAMLMSTLFRV